MSTGGSGFQVVNIVNTYDPRVTGAAGKKGTTFLYIPSVGDPEMLLKSDDGFSVNWISMGATPPLPITTAAAASVADVTIATAPANLDGVPGVVGELWLLKNQALPEENGVYDFNGVGVALTRNANWAVAADFIPGLQVYADEGTVNQETLWANADYVAALGVDPIQFVKVSSSVVVGDPNTLAYFDAAGNLTDNTSAKFDSVLNSEAVGLETTGGVVSAVGSAAKAFGGADGAGSAIQANGNYSFAHGQATAGGVIAASSNGSTSFGAADGAAASILTSGQGSQAHGYADAATTIVAIDTGGYAHGMSLGAGSEIRSGNIGATAHGAATGGGLLRSLGVGSLAFGNPDGTGLLLASGNGALASGVSAGAGSELRSQAQGSEAMGTADAGGIISADAAGSKAHGFVQDVGSNITAGGPGSTANGFAMSVGTLLSPGVGSKAHGFVQSGSITATGDGSNAHGTTSTSGLLNASGPGACVHGAASGVGATISATAHGAESSGLADGGVISAINLGAKAFGHTAIAAATLTASGVGSSASGYLDDGSILASGHGSSASGQTTNPTSSITASGIGSFARGLASGAGSTITASGIGSKAYGEAISGGAITASGTSSTATGKSDDSTILASGIAAFASGFANGAASILRATGDGSQAFGYAIGGGTVSAEGGASFAHGVCNVAGAVLRAVGVGSYASGWVSAAAADTLAFGDMSFVHGLGVETSSYGTTVFGRFNADYGGTIATWVSTEPLFILGNGTSNASRSNAFQIDKDGRQVLTAAELNSAIRMVSGPDTISERTDYAIVCDTTGAGGALTLPAAIDGQKFLFMSAGAGPAVYTFTVNGADTLDVSVVPGGISTGVTQGLMALGGVWYSSTN